MNFLNSLMVKLKLALDGNTEVGHAVAALVMFWSLAWVSLGAAIATPLAWCGSQELRDHTRKSLEETKGTYWTRWIKVIPDAFLSNDFTFPAAATVASIFVWLRFFTS